MTQEGNTGKADFKLLCRHEKDLFRAVQKFCQSAGLIRLQIF